jgi:DNA-binding NtrC family response regulator
MASVLIVDDEQPIRHLVGRWLSDAGYEFAEAENAEAALTAMEAREAAVAFCDVQMPGHDGIWLTKQLRAKYPTTAVVLATGVTTVPPNVSMQSGVLAYLVKPFRRETLLDALLQALSWHRDAKSGIAKPTDAVVLDEWLDSLETE